MAAEFAASAAANAVGNLTTEYASPYVSYFFRFGKIVEEFKNRRNELELKSDRIKNEVEEAIRQNEVIEKDVQDWRKRAEKELEETQRLEAEIERIKCFNWCPSWGWRYCLSKKVAKKTISIDKLLVSCNFPRVGHRNPPEGIEFFTSKDFMPYESSNFTFNEIIKALNTDGVNMIGLYGMAGVGKTTLAKEVGKHAKEQNLFDKVVMATMSQTPNINKIQDKIAAIVGLKFQESIEDVRAEELGRRLQGVEKILIIIDDVWKEFKLQTVGIPFGVEHGGCKILLTTRLRRVCVRMNCQQQFQLDILSQDEAWALFKDTAGLKDVSSRLNDVAKKVARECKGLPLAIVTIGKALKGASLDGWKAANKRLKDSRHFDNGHIYNCLKLSYDYLKGDNIRTCFLLCSLFPEDWGIKIEELVMFAIGHGLFSHIYLIEDLRREIREALRNLQESGLLLRTDDDDDERYVRMHDVVRDFAHWITSTGKNIFMVKEGLMEWPPSESCGSHTAISFWNSNINIFPEKLEFPELKILIFTGKTLVKVPIAFVEGMKALRVLRLENVIFSLEVLKLVTNLRTLCLVKCELENISSLGNMKNLEILAFSDTNIYELPEELAALRGLKSLHFFDSGREQINFPPNLLSRLTSLQELYVICENNVNLSELNSLSCLTVLSLRVSTAQCFPEVFPKLQSYIIVVNEYVEFMPGPNFRTLEIVDSTSLSAYNELFCNVEKLALENVMGHKNIVPNVDPEGLNQLTSLELKDCHDMKCLMDTTGEKGPTTAFSNLEKLRMEEMTCLKELCHGLLPIRFLQKLKNVAIVNCEMLKVVFEIDGLLEKEEISQAPLLLNLTSLHLHSLSELESIWKLQSTHQYHASLKSLKYATIRKCSELKSIFPPCLSQSLLHLQQLEISQCNRLEKVFDFPQEVGELESMNSCQVRPLFNLTSLELCTLPELKWIWKGPTHLVKLQNLKTMRIEKCLKLAYLFPTPLAQSLVHLEVLEISHCDSLEHLIFGEAENVDQIVSNMDGYALCWPKLITLNIINCGRLKYVFPITLAQGLPYLESVEITDCSQLKQVFNITKDKGGRSPQDIVLQRLQILRLKNLEKLNSFCSENFVMSLSLKEFQVCNCPHIIEFKTLQTHLKGLKFRMLNAGRFSSSLSALKELFCNVEKLNLEDVEKLNLEAVKGHKNIVPNVDPKGLNGLTSLKIRYCDDVECLMDTAGEKGPTTAFSNLLKLRMEDMTCLKELCHGPLPIRFLQKLKDVTIEDCEMLKVVFEMDGLLEQKKISRTPLLSNLTNLNLLSLPELKSIWKLQSTHQHHASLRSLKVVNISRCSKLKAIFPPCLAQSLLPLQKLSLHYCDGLEQIIDFTLEMGELEVLVFSNLTSLELESLPELKWIWKGPTHLVKLQNLKTMRIEKCLKLAYLFPTPLAQSLEHLEVLEICHCHSLEHLIFDEAENEEQIVSNIDGYSLCWPKLITLEIINCRRMKYVFPNTLAQGLPNLESVKITDCSQLKQVFNMTKDKGRRPPQDTVLQRLQILRLKNLEKLSSFCPENFVMSLSLKEFGVCNCPQLIEFKTLQTHLKELRFFEFEQDNVCDTINWENIFQIQNPFSKIEILYLEGIHQLQGPIQVASLPYLEDLKVSNCSRLKSLFSSMLAPNLPQLKVLDIECCERLEEIIEMDQTSIATSSQGHLQPISFRSLQCIWIFGCSNLKSLFPISVTRSLSNLKRIEIKGASKLEQVFWYQGELNIEDDQKGIVLPKLGLLNLSELSDLKSFAPIGYHFRFPSLHLFKITKSPKFTTSVVMDSKHPVHAIKEEPRQVQNNTTENFEEIVDNQSTCNDIFWNRGWQREIPLYMTMGETRIMLREELKNS